MKSKIILLLATLFFFCGTTVFAQNANKDTSQVYEVVEQMPSFPGGQGALNLFLANNVKYPVVAAENGIQGRVLVGFIVECDGSLSNIKVERSVDPTLDKEAVRVVKAMPKWQPGKAKGSTVRVKFTVPIVFRMQ